jgi:hypothetical protein
LVRGAQGFSGFRDALLFLIALVRFGPKRLPSGGDLRIQLTEQPNRSTSRLNGFAKGALDFFSRLGVVRVL